MLKKETNYFPNKKCSVFTSKNHINWRPLFSIYFAPFQTTFLTQKSKYFWGIHTQIVGVEGKHLDHSTTLQHISILPLLKMH